MLLVSRRALNNPLFICYIYIIFLVMVVLESALATCIPQRKTPCALPPLYFSNFPCQEAWICSPLHPSLWLEIYIPSIVNGTSRQYFPFSSPRILSIYEVIGPTEQCKTMSCRTNSIEMPPPLALNLGLNIFLQQLEEMVQENELHACQPTLNS